MVSKYGLEEPTLGEFLQRTGYKLLKILVLAKTGNVNQLENNLK